MLVYITCDEKISKRKEFIFTMKIIFFFQLVILTQDASYSYYIRIGRTLFRTLMVRVSKIFFLDTIRILLVSMRVLIWMTIFLGSNFMSISIIMSTSLSWTPFFLVIMEIRFNDSIWWGRESLVLVEKNSFSLEAF